MNSRHFVPNLLRYMCAKTDLNVTSTVLAKLLQKQNGAIFWGHSVEARICTGKNSILICNPSSQQMQFSCAICQKLIAEH